MEKSPSANACGLQVGWCFSGERTLRDHLPNAPGLQFHTRQLGGRRRRGGDAEFARFCTIALGSANELDYFLLLARDLGYLPSGSYEQLTSEVREVSRMLAGLIRKLKGKE